MVYLWGRMHWPWCLCGGSEDHWIQRINHAWWQVLLPLIHLTSPIRFKKKKKKKVQGRHDFFMVSSNPMLECLGLLFLVNFLLHLILPC